jgi:sialate O-acetylesterase
LPGERLAKIALAKDYGIDLVYSGPKYKEHSIKKISILFSFDHVHDGLMSGIRKTSVAAEPSDQPLAMFSIAGKDQIFHWADAKIIGNQIRVSSSKVDQPVAVRYAWADQPKGANLYNLNGLPASPFRTDDWPCISEKNVIGKVNVVR